MHLIKIGVLDFHAGYGEHSCLVLTCGEIVRLDGAGAYSVLAVYRDYHRFSGADTFVHSADEVELTRCVDDIYAGVLPYRRGEGSVYRDLAAYLLRVEVAYGAALVGVAHSLSCS